jgi:hypothetical protein
MSSSNWDFTGTNSAVLNSSISPNPLPTGSFGEFCRAFSGDSSMLIKSSYQSGAFIGIPSTKAIRVRGAIRKQFNTSYYSGGIVVKWDSIYSRGYSIAYNAASQGINLQFNNGEAYALPVGGNVNNDWYSMQMEIFPIGTTADRIIVSQETSFGSGIYTQLSINGGIPSEGILISSADPKYSSWGGTGRCGVVSGLSYAEWNGGIYVDKLSFELSNAP